MRDAMAGGGYTTQAALMVELREAAGHLIRCCQQRHTELFTDEFQRDLTGPQYAVISAVSSDSGVDQRTAGERASLDKSTTAAIVARLEAQGWLRLEKDAADGRRKSLRLTPLARTALREVTRRVELVQHRLLAPLPLQSVGPFLESLRLVAYAGEPPAPGSHDGRSVLTLRDTPGHLIRRAEQIHTIAWNMEVGRAMTAPQYAVLSALWAHPEGIDQKMGADLASVDSSGMSDIVARLVNKGWVARTRDPDDGRRRLVSLTDSVQTELIGLTPAVRRVQEQLLRPLDAAQRRELLDGLSILAFADDDRERMAKAY